METLYLSRRNLLTLLSKLDRKEKGESTTCAIVKYRRHNVGQYIQSVEAVVIVAVPDEEYYVALGRKPGEVLESDEEAMYRGNWK